MPHSWTTAAPEIQLAVQATPTFSSSAGADPTALNGMPAGLLSGMALASLAARGTTGGGGTRSGTSTDGQEDGRKPPVVVIREQPPPGNPRGKVRQPFVAARKMPGERGYPTGRSHRL